MINWLKRLLASGAKRNAVEQIALDAGLLQECPVCRTVVDKQNDDRLAPAMQLAEQRLNARDAALTDFNGDLEELHRQVREIREHYPYVCICEDAG